MGYSIRVKQTHHIFIMATQKTYKFTVSGRGYSSTEFIEATNPNVARQRAEARFPDAKLYGFNESR
jgi:hypothetical protein